MVFRVRKDSRLLSTETLLMSGRVPKPNTNIYKLPEAAVCMAMAPNKAT